MTYCHLLISNSCDLQMQRMCSKKKKKTNTKTFCDYLEDRKEGKRKGWLRQGLWTHGVTEL